MCVLENSDKSEIWKSFILIFSNAFGHSYKIILS